MRTFRVDNVTAASRSIRQQTVGQVCAHPALSRKPRRVTIAKQEGKPSRLACDI